MKPLHLLALLFVLSFGVTFFVLQKPSSPSENSVRIAISTGESVADVAESLKAEGVISSTTAFRFYLAWKDMDRSILPGVFLIPRRASYRDVARILTEGNGKEVAITIPEGFTIAQIDTLLAEKGLIEAGTLLACAREACDFSSFAFLPPSDKALREARLEGYLFPDTYFVHPAEFVPKFFLERLLTTFQERVLLGLAEDLAVSGRPLHEIVTMASLIERETREASERPIVAGILWKRFDSGRALDVDATVRYALQKTTEPLTKTDLEMDSPYNTRRYPGLPPGPIANPGRESVRAALHPEDSPYWYYLHGKDGRIHYSETNDEHNEKKARYL